jgi:hypothetical protein
MHSVGTCLVIIKYLPAKPKYRAFIERCVEFLEKVYRDEVLADLEFVAYSKFDQEDLKKVRERGLVKYTWSYYDTENKRAIVAGSHAGFADLEFGRVVEEVTHHVLWNPEYKERVIKSLLQDIPRLNVIPHLVPIRSKQDFTALHVFFNELDTAYIVHNYFLTRKVKPELRPWVLFQVFIAGFKELQAYFLELHGVSSAPILADIMYEELLEKKNPLSNFKETVHAIFTEVIKRFPAEVYNSNPSRYEVLFKHEFIPQIPL